MRMWTVFFVGVLVGLICVGGLTLGVTWLFKSSDEKTDPARRPWLALMGGTTLIGQFLLAGFILFAVPGLDEHPLALAVGLLSMNLALPFVALNRKRLLG